MKERKLTMTGQNFLVSMSSLFNVLKDSNSEASMKRDS